MFGVTTTTTLKLGNKLIFSVMDHDDFDFDDELGVACVPYHDVPYVSPGMIPPGPVWLDLTTYEEAMEKKKSKARGRLSERFGKAAADSSSPDTLETSIATATVPPVGASAS